MASVSAKPRRRRARRRYHQRPRGGRYNIELKKPRKPLSAFNGFVVDFFRTTTARNFRSAPLAMKYAGEFWRSHPNIRQNYYDRVLSSYTNYRAAYAEYKKRKALVKRPGNSYIHFTKQYWLNEGQGKTFAEVGKLASEIWKQMTAAKKQPYVDSAAAAQHRYSTMMEELASGRRRFEDFYNHPAKSEETGLNQ